MQLNVLVVGGAGYIGSHAALALKRRGYEPIIYDNLGAGHAELAQGFELIVGDISDAAKLTPILKRVDAVMHFAAHAYVGESIVLVAVEWPIVLLRRRAGAVSTCGGRRSCGPS